MISSKVGYIIGYYGLNSRSSLVEFSKELPNNSDKQRYKDVIVEKSVQQSSVYCHEFMAPCPITCSGLDNWMY
jgi:hypothetical protein